MRAATIRDREIVIEEHPDPTPGSGEVLVRVHAAGLNGADMMQRRGLYPAPPGSPQDIPGMELAGEVAAVGEGAERFQTGDRVMGLVGGGAGAKGEINLLALMGKRARIHGSTLRARPLEEKALAARHLEREVLPLFVSGDLRVPVAEAFALEEAAAAYERFAAGGKLGKIVITV